MLSKKYSSSEFNVDGSYPRERQINRAYADAIIIKLEAFSKYWKVQFTKQEDYIQIKDTLEDEVKELKEKRAAQKGKTTRNIAIGVIGFILLMILAGLIPMISR